MGAVRWPVPHGMKLMEPHDTPTTPVSRELLHTRQVRYQGYRRADGLWDIEATMSDVRSYDSLGIDSTVLQAGDPVHDMTICLTLDDTLTVRAVASRMAAVPATVCQQAQPPLQAMVGVCMTSGWRHAIERAMGRTKGCTHLRELLFNMATAAYQTIPVRISQLKRLANPQQEASREAPSHLGGCMTWDLSGPTVQRYYPMSYVPPATPDGQEPA